MAAAVLCAVMAANTLTKAGGQRFSSGLLLIAALMLYQPAACTFLIIIFFSIAIRSFHQENGFSFIFKKLGELLAVSIVGATVMPHVIYLHSAMTKDRAPGRDEDAREGHQPRETLRAELLRLRVDVGQMVAGPRAIVDERTLGHGVSLELKRLDRRSTAPRPPPPGQPCP